MGEGARAPMTYTPSADDDTTVCEPSRLIGRGFMLVRRPCRRVLSEKPATFGCALFRKLFLVVAFESIRARVPERIRAAQLTFHAELVYSTSRT